MALLLTTPATAEPVALADVKAHLRLTIDDDDAYISALITTARRAIEGRYGLALLPQGWALFADRWPKDKVFHLPLWPVLSVDSLVSFDDRDTPTIIDPSQYFFDAASRPARLSLRAGHVLPEPSRVINGLKLAFTAGFGVDASFVPHEIKEAIMATVADWYLNRGDEGGGTLPATAIAAMGAWRNTRLKP